MRGGGVKGRGWFAGGFGNEIEQLHDGKPGEWGRAGALHAFCLPQVLQKGRAVEDLPHCPLPRRASHSHHSNSALRSTFPSSAHGGLSLLICSPLLPSSRKALVL